MSFAGFRAPPKPVPAEGGNVTFWDTASGDRLSRHRPSEEETGVGGRTEEQDRIGVCIGGSALQGALNSVDENMMPKSWGGGQRGPGTRSRHHGASIP